MHLPSVKVFQIGFSKRYYLRRSVDLKSSLKLPIKFGIIIIGLEDGIVVDFRHLWIPYSKMKDWERQKVGRLTMSRCGAEIREFQGQMIGWIIPQWLGLVGDRDGWDLWDKKTRLLLCGWMVDWRILMKAPRVLKKGSLFCCGQAARLDFFFCILHKMSPLLERIRQLCKTKSSNIHLLFVKICLLTFNQ